MVCVGRIVFVMMAAVAVVTGLADRVAASDAKIALFPFSINAEKKLTFLQNGIADTIFARLSTVKREIVKIDALKRVDQKEIFRIAREADSALAVTGSITVFGNSVSINAFLYDIKTEKPLVAFNKSNESQETLFDAIGLFTDEVIAASHPDGGAAKPLIKEDVEKKETIVKPVVPNESVVKKTTVKYAVDSLATGDVDGDGTVEIVFTDKHDLYIAEWNNDTVTIKYVIKGKHYLRIISTDVGDMNNNGISEIYITSVRSKSNSVTASCIEWDGKSYVKSDVGDGWYVSVRPIKPGGKPQLIGQKQKFGAGIFGTGIYTLMLNQKDKSYLMGPGVSVLPHMNIYDFTYGDIMNRNKQQLVAYTKKGYLSVYDEKNDEVWKSTDIFGGSQKYLETRKSEMQTRVYLKPRIIAADIDGDSVTEVVTIKNRNSTPRAFVNLQNFKDGHIEALIWKTNSLESKWETQQMKGYISDFDVNDMDNDGKNELIYAVVKNRSKFFKKKKTEIVIQPVGTL